ncbi:MAG: peptidoglycan DD-metalloendopeptidase family protein [Alphaproteobacteria bacterium]
MRYSLIAYLPILLLLAACFGSQNPAPVSRYGHTPGEGSAGVHVVQPGDTLYTISNSYQLAMQDIVFINRLQAPFHVRAGQRLRLPPPQTYRVRSGDTLYNVSRLFNTDMSAVARQNNLRAPYRLSEGQVLRLPSRSIAQAQQVQQASQGMAMRPPQKPERSMSTAQQNIRPPASVQPPQRVAATPPPRSSSRFLQPVSGRLLSGFGAKPDGLHNDGINIGAPRGTPVKAAENGVVVYVGNELRGTGNLILIRHDGGYITAYAHLDAFKVARGQTVQRGDVIGAVGSTGSVSTPQLHFEIRRGTQAIDPKSYIDI